MHKPIPGPIFGDSETSRVWESLKKQPENENS